MLRMTSICDTCLSEQDFRYLSIYGEFRVCHECMARLSGGLPATTAEEAEWREEGKDWKKFVVQKPTEFFAHLLNHYPAFLIVKITQEKENERVIIHDDKAHIAVYRGADSIVRFCHMLETYAPITMIIQVIREIPDEES